MAGKRDEMLQTALRIIASSGASDFSSKMIAAELGCSEALVYKYFPSKNDLMKGCLEYIHSLNDELFRDIFPKVLEGIDDPFDRIRAMSDAYLKFHIDHWSETLAFEQLRKSIHQDEIREDYKAMQLEDIQYVIEIAGLESYAKDFEEILPLKVWWLHMIHVTTFFVKKVYYGILEDDESTYELFFNLLYKGTADLIPGGN